MTDTADKNIENLFLCGALALVCAVVNTAAFILLLGSSVEVMSILTVSLVLVAPLIEEGVKRIAVWRKMPWMFLLVFCCVETFFLAGGAGVVGLAVRILPCLLHACTMTLQWWTWKKSIEMRSPMISVFGFWGAFAIHALYNGAVVFFMNGFLG